MKFLWQLDGQDTGDGELCPPWSAVAVAGKKTEKNGVPIWDVGRPQKIGWSSGPVETAKIVVFDVLCI